MNGFISPGLAFGIFLIAASFFSALSALWLADWVARRFPDRAAPPAPALADPVAPPPVEPAVAQPSQDLMQELAFLRRVADLSPLVISLCDGNGRVTWGNEAYRELARDCPETPGSLADLFDGARAGNSGTPTDRVAVEGKALHWFEQVSHPLGNGETLRFALPADPVVKAEQALHNFVQTLTKTFAHLPTGLAVFDRDRRLALFNPALTDLTALEPDWLAERPTLYDFLDRLRENRHIPEPRDYKAWRDRVVMLEKAAESGRYEEDWTLPEGQTYRVTGRPHPEGAVAFLFEDITATITLERKFRSDLELGSSVLDALEDAVAVFDATGELFLSNDAFARLWGADPRERITRLTLFEALEIWSAAVRPCVALRRFRDFLAAGNAASKGGGTIRLKSGRRLHFAFSRLPRGVVFCRFSDQLPVPRRGAAKSHLAA